MQNAPVRAFKEERLLVTEDINDFIPRKLVWNQYRDFMSSHDLECEEQNVFWHSLYMLAPQIQTDNSIRKMVDGRQERIVRYVQLVGMSKDRKG